MSKFPGENLPNCSCAEASASEENDIVHFFGEEKHSKMLELANVRWIRVTAGGSPELSDIPNWKLTNGGKKYDCVLVILL